MNSPLDTQINLAFSVKHTEAEGPGARFAIWVQGCSLACPGCCNPEMWEHGTGQSVSVGALVEQIKGVQDAIEGVSFLGGEPFEQHEALAILAREVRALGLTVMVYSGYSFDEIQAKDSPLFPEIDLLVAGRYVADLRTTKRRWIGSTNQTLHCLSDAYKDDDPRFLEPNHAEIKLNSQGELTVVGFPFRSVMKAFPRKDSTEALDV